MTLVSCQCHNYTRLIIFTIEQNTHLFFHTAHERYKKDLTILRLNLTTLLTLIQKRSESISSVKVDHLVQHHVFDTAVLRHLLLRDNLTTCKQNVHIDQKKKKKRAAVIVTESCLYPQCRDGW